MQLTAIQSRNLVIGALAFGFLLNLIINVFGRDSPIFLRIIGVVFCFLMLLEIVMLLMKKHVVPPNG